MSRNDEVYHHVLFSKSVSLPTLQPTDFAQHPVLKPPLLDLSCIYLIHNFYSHKIQCVHSYIFSPFKIRYNNYLLKLFTYFYLLQIGGIGQVVA